MKNTFKKVLVISLVLLTVLTLFIACNENNDNIVTSIKKPTAKPDPNNPYDKLSSYKKYTEDDITDDTTIHITLTNSESLNNLFYDYTVEDFGDEYFKSISENCTENLSVARNAYNGVNDSYIPDFKTYLRGFNLTLKNPGKHQLLECIDYLIEKDEIRIAEPLYVNKITWFSTTPNDTYLSNQWALDKIQAYDAWDKTTGSSEVRVGLIDSGINNTHEDLSANISTTLSYGTNPYEDVAPHGTMTAGVIGAVGNNNKGISGVCWNVDIVSLKAVNSSGEEDPTEMANAINYAQTNHIPIVNFSGGFYQNNDEKIESLRAAIQSYTGLVIVSAGNEGYNLDDENVQLYPQCFDLANILVVGATDSNDAIYSTNYGATTVDLFAPGRVYIPLQKQAHMLIKAERHFQHHSSRVLPRL